MEKPAPLRSPIKALCIMTLGTKSPRPLAEMLPSRIPRLASRSLFNSGDRVAMMTPGGSSFQSLINGTLVSSTATRTLRRRWALLMESGSVRVSSTPLDRFFMDWMVLEKVSNWPPPSLSRPWIMMKQETPRPSQELVAPSRDVASTVTPRSL